MSSFREISRETQIRAACDSGWLSDGGEQRRAAVSLRPSLARCRPTKTCGSPVVSEAIWPGASLPCASGAAGSLLGTSGPAPVWSLRDGPGMSHLRAVRMCPPAAGAIAPAGPVCRPRPAPGMRDGVRAPAPHKHRGSAWDRFLIGWSARHRCAARSSVTEREPPHIGDRYGFRGLRLLIPGIAPPNQDSAAGFRVGGGQLDRLWGSKTGHRLLTCGFVCGSGRAAGSIAGL